MYREFSCDVKRHVILYRRHIGVQLLRFCGFVTIMVLFVIIGCSKRSGRDKDVSFFRIPTIITCRTDTERELSTR